MDDSMIESTIKITKLTASEGMVLTNGDTFSKEVYLGKNDSPANWHEITENQASQEQSKALEAATYV